MVKVDYRRGSDEFRVHLRRLGIPCKKATLPYADFSFHGNGPDGRVRIGVERKTLSELITAVEDNRFIGHQLPGLLKTYDWVYVVCEGTYRPDRTSGILMSGGREAGFTRDRHLYENFEKFILSLERKARVTVRTTTGKLHTAYFIRALYKWAEKSWDSHKSVYKVDETTPDFAIMDERTVRRKILAQVPAIGWKRSRAASEYFPSAGAAVRGVPYYDLSERERAAMIEVWCGVKWVTNGKKMRIGPGTAAKIVRMLYAEKDDTKGKGR